MKKSILLILILIVCATTAQAEDYKTPIQQEIERTKTFQEKGIRTNEYNADGTLKGIIYRIPNGNKEGKAGISCYEDGKPITIEEHLKRLEDIKKRDEESIKRETGKFSSERIGREISVPTESYNKDGIEVIGPPAAQQLKTEYQQLKDESATAQQAMEEIIRMKQLKDVRKREREKEAWKQGMIWTKPQWMIEEEKAKEELKGSDDKIYYVSPGGNITIYGTIAEGIEALNLCQKQNKWMEAEVMKEGPEAVYSGDDGKISKEEYLEKLRKEYEETERALEDLKAYQVKFQQIRPSDASDLQRAKQEQIEHKQAREKLKARETQKRKQEKEAWEKGLLWTKPQWMVDEEKAKEKKWKEGVRAKRAKEEKVQKEEPTLLKTLVSE